jgi:hypothetical protein
MTQSLVNPLLLPFKSKGVVFAARSSQGLMAAMDSLSHFCVSKHLCKSHLLVRHEDDRGKYVAGWHKIYPSPEVLKQYGVKFPS